MWRLMKDSKRDENHQYHECHSLNKSDWVSEVLTERAWERETTLEKPIPFHPKSKLVNVVVTKKKGRTDRTPN